MFKWIILTRQTAIFNSQTLRNISAQLWLRCRIFFPSLSSFHLCAYSRCSFAIFELNGMNLPRANRMNASKDGKTNREKWHNGKDVIKILISAFSIYIWIRLHSTPLKCMHSSSFFFLHLFFLLYLENFFSFQLINWFVTPTQDFLLIFCLNHQELH